MDASTCEEELEELLARHAVEAASAAHETTSLAHELRAEGEERLRQAATRQPGDELGELQATARAKIACAERLLELASCQRLAADAASSALERCVLDRR